MKKEVNFLCIEPGVSEVEFFPQFEGVFDCVAEDVVVEVGVNAIGTLPIFSNPFRPRAEHRFSVVACVSA